MALHRANRSDPDGGAEVGSSEVAIHVGVSITGRAMPLPRQRQTEDPTTIDFHWRTRHRTKGLVPCTASG